MATKETLQRDTLALSQKPSSRQQRKIDQAVKIMESKGHLHSKTHARRVHADPHLDAPKSRKLLKSVEATGSTEEPVPDNASSVPSSSEHPSKETPLLPQHESQTPATVLNPRYELVTSIHEHDLGACNLLGYILNYTYQESGKQSDKETIEWESLAEVGQQDIAMECGGLAQSALEKFRERFQQEKELHREEPFAKGHREFRKKYLNEEYLFRERRQ